MAGQGSQHNDRGLLGNWAGSQWRLHPLPAADRTVPGSTPSRRRVTQDDPISGGKGVRRHCGRNTGIAVALSKKRCKNARNKRRATRTDQNTRPKHRPNRDPTPGTKHRPQPSANGDETKKKKKKNRSGSGTLGVGVGDDVRIDVESASRSKKHKGKPKPKRFGFPQRLRERKREHTASTNKPYKKRRGQANTKPNTGRVVKG